MNAEIITMLGGFATLLAGEVAELRGDFSQLSRAVSELRGEFRGRFGSQPAAE